MNINMLKLTDISTGKNDNDPPVDKVYAPAPPPQVESWVRHWYQLQCNFRAASSTAY